MCVDFLYVMDTLRFLRATRGTNILKMADTHVFDNYYLCITLLITIVYQLVFFLIAFTFKFDKVTGM